MSDTGGHYTEYPVEEGDTFQSIAQQHGIDHWEDLWRLNQEQVPNPDLLGPLDPHGDPVVLRIPDDRDHARGKELLGELAESDVEAQAFQGGASWLDPRALFSHTYVDSKGCPLQKDVLVHITDPVTGRERTLQTRLGQVQVRLPRKDFDFRVELFPGFDDHLGWFNELRTKGDLMETHLEQGPKLDEAPEAGSRRRAAAGGLPRDPISTTTRDAQVPPGGQRDPELDQESKAVIEAPLDPVDDPTDTPL